MVAHRTRAWSVLLALLAMAGTAGCDDSKKRMAEKQRVLAAEKKKIEEAKVAELKAKAPKNERARLDAPWGGSDNLEVLNGTPCPEGLWALFPETPEGLPADVAGKKDALADKVKGASFTALLPLGGVVTLGKYDKKKKVLPVVIDGVFGCFDKGGVLSFALTSPARPFRPKPSEQEELSPQAVWRSPPLVVKVPFATAAEAKEFANGKGAGLEARIAFTLGKVEVDKKLLKPPKPLEGAPPTSDTPVDWGAGRLVHAELIGTRLGLDHEKTELAVELRKQAKR